MLGRNDDGIHSERDDGPAVTLVLNRHLGLGIWSEPGESAGPSCDRQSLVELVGENDGKRHQFWSFGGGISEHETLIAGPVILEGALVKALGDIRGLLFNSNEDVAGLVVETLGRVIVPNVLDGFSDDLLVVELGRGGNFAKDHDHSGLGSGLTCDLGGRVLLQASVELCGICQDRRGEGTTGDTHNSIRDLIANLVWVSLTDRFGCEEEVAGGKGWASGGVTVGRHFRGCGG